MKTRKAMKAAAQEQIDRLDNANIDNYELSNEMLKIVEECETDSSTAYIYEMFFELGDFSANKRGITNLIKKVEAQRAADAAAAEASQPAESPAPVEKPILYKVYKIGRKSYRRKILYRNLSLDEARTVVNRYPDSSRSMVVFSRQ